MYKQYKTFSKILEIFSESFKFLLFLLGTRSLILTRSLVAVARIFLPSLQGE